MAADERKIIFLRDTPSDTDAADARVKALEQEGWAIEKVERAPTTVVIAGEVTAHVTPPRGVWVFLTR